MLTSVLIYLLTALFGYVFILCLRCILKPKVGYLAFMVATFIACDCFALALPTSLSEDLTNYNLRPEWLLRAACAYVPLALLTAIYLHWTALKRPQSDLKHTTRQELCLTQVGWYLAIGLLFLLSLITLRYMYITGFEKAFAWTSVSDRISGYEVRYSFEDAYNQGAWSSLVAADCFIPLLAGLVMFYGPNWTFPMRVMLTLPPLLLAFLRLLSELQRGPPLILLLTMALLYMTSFLLWKRKRQMSWTGVARLLLVIGGVVFIAGVFVYNISDGTANPAFRLVQRIFVIPSHTAALYFGLFPDSLPYRGFSGTFSIPLGSWETYNSGPTSIMQVGYSGNGWAHVANANYIATAYSGMGWVSVILITVLVFILLVLWSRFLGRFGFKMSLLFVISQLQCCLVLVNADLMSAYTFGFFFGPLALWLLARPPWMKPATYRRVGELSSPIGKGDPILVD